MTQSIADYATKWGLKINVGKSEIYIFEKGKKVCDFEWSIGADILEVVDQFCYLGVKFSKTGLMHYAVSALHDQALRDMSNLLFLFKKVKVDIKTELLLFDVMVSPILLYGAGVWGIYCLKSVENCTLNFAKSFLESELCCLW